MIVFMKNPDRQARLFAGVDGGGTKCRVRLRDAEGQLLAQAEGGPANIRLGLNMVWANILDALSHALQQAGRSDAYEHIAIGLTTATMLTDAEYLLCIDGDSLPDPDAIGWMLRHFLKDPGVVILDEPSSRMDLATEALLERAMEKLLEGRTAIIIAHRLSTVSRADEILILEHGKIREHGIRAELAADSTTYFHRLLQTGLEKELA